jgi:molybdopterin/thiamine biosynthesis adenylyltransferase
MENIDTQSLYNPNGLIALRRIDKSTNENTYPLYKATQLEEILNRNNLLEQRIEHQEKQIGQVLNNLTKEGWYSNSIDKSEVLQDLCEIFDHEAKQEIRITAKVNVEIRYDVPLDEIDDFDAHYFLQDNLSIDSYNGDVIVDSFDVEDTDVEY